MTSDPFKKVEATLETLERISHTFDKGSAERHAIDVAARALTSEVMVEQRRKYAEFLKDFPVTDAMIASAHAGTATSPEGTMAVVHGEMWVLVIDPDGQRRLVRPIPIDYSCDELEGIDDV